MFEKEFEHIFNKADRKKIKNLEILLIKHNSFSINIFKNNIEKFSYSDSIGLGLRIIKDSCVGYSYTEKLETESFDNIINKALENAKFIEDKEIVKLCNYPDIEKSFSIYNEDLEKLNVKEKIDIAKELEASAFKYDKRVFNVPYSIFGNNKVFIKIANTEGLNKQYTTNMAHAYAVCLARENSQSKSGVHYNISRKPKEIKPGKIGKKAAEKAVYLLGAKEIPSGKYPIIFNNEMAAQILNTFTNTFSAKEVQEGKSLLRNKLGKTIANNKVSIVDNPLMDNAFSSRPFDYEGYPSQKTDVIKNGILNSYLHNTSTAHKDNTESTSNAIRSYKSTIDIAPSNMFIKNGTTPKKELYNKFPKIIEIVELAGMHSGCNTISGDFSLSAQGFFFEKENKHYPIHNFTISGNFFQLLQNIILVANDLKFNMNSIGSPSILVKELNISGK